VPIDFPPNLPINCNWAGGAMQTWAPFCRYSRRDHDGLLVQAIFNPASIAHAKGFAAEIGILHIEHEHHPNCPTWNYIIRSRTAPLAGTRVPGRFVSTAP
jgi:hypothetical protein